MHPTKRNKLRDAKAVAETEGEHGLIAMRPTAPGRRLNEPGNLGHNEMPAGF
jgi:hypothetical protein